MTDFKHITFSLAILMLPLLGMSCDCEGIGIKESVKNSDLIFLGRILSVTDDPGSCYNDDCIAVFVKVEIIENIKGSTDSVSTIRTMKYSPACGYPFKVNQSYLIYAGQNNKSIRVSLCSRTNELESVREEIVKVKEILKK